MVGLTLPTDSTNDDSTDNTNINEPKLKCVLIKRNFRIFKYS
jgi:hypothetical protein